MPMVELYPLKFNSILKTKVWGGSRIASFKGIAGKFENIGESWELSAVEGSESLVSEGALAGKSIAELSEQYKGRLLGEKVYAATGAEFPLLVKFLDAHDDLSIQVHPDDELAARHGHGRGKAEMWYVMDADKGACIMSGLKKGITPEEYTERIADDSITEVLCDYEPRKGDVYFIPAGRVHSMGGGCFVVEIQETSDLTYRIYDYGRPGLDGKPRELHTELAREAIDYTVLEDYRTHYEHRKNEETGLVSCRHFSTYLYELDTPFAKSVDGLDSFVIIICLEGNGSLRDDRGNEVGIRQGETVLLPACTRNFTLTPDDSLKILAAHI